MKLRLLLLMLTVIFVVSGCGLVQTLLDQIEVANTFASFAPEFGQILDGSSNSLSNKARETLADEVSLSFDISSELDPSKLATSLTVANYSGQFEITDVPVDDFITFLTAENSEDVPEYLQAEWLIYDDFRQQKIDNLTIYTNGTVFDGDLDEFDRDTFRAIRGIININNGFADLQALISVDINDQPYNGNIKVEFMELGEDTWVITKIALELKIVEN